MEELEALRRQKPHLDLVLTHVDDRFDTGMREAIGADAARVLPLLDRRTFTFLIEDPATVWHLGPQRYHSIAERYLALTPHHEKLAIDLNIVEPLPERLSDPPADRHRTVPTGAQRRLEFPARRLVLREFPAPPDLDLLPSASASAATVQQSGSKSVVDSVVGVGIPWKGPALVDGHPWPVGDEDTLWLPPGPHRVEAGGQYPDIRLIRLNADLKGARVISRALEFTYESSARAIAVVNRWPQRLLIDGTERPITRAGPASLLLPPAAHRDFGRRLR